MKDRPAAHLVDRAVQIWANLLKDPVYDNGDKSLAGVAGKKMAEHMPRNNDPKRLEAFANALRKRVLTPRENGQYDTWLAVDYGPNGPLSDAAEEVGLEMEFPWKTTVHIRDDSVYVSTGYHDEPTYHYPLGDGRWLVTKLTGSEIEKVIEYVNGGSPEFKVEESYDIID